MQTWRCRASSSIDYRQTWIFTLIALVGTFTPAVLIYAYRSVWSQLLGFELFSTHSVLEMLPFIAYPGFLQKNKWNVIFNKMDSSTIGLLNSLPSLQSWIISFVLETNDLARSKLKHTLLITSAFKEQENISYLQKGC